MLHQRLVENMVQHVAALPHETARGQHSRIQRPGLARVGKQQLPPVAFADFSVRAVDAHIEIRRQSFVQPQNLRVFEGVGFAVGQGYAALDIIQIVPVRYRHGVAVRELELARDAARRQHIGRIGRPVHGGFEGMGRGRAVHGRA